MKLIGLSGTNGSGKDSVAGALVKNHNFFFVSGSDLLRKEANRRQLTTERETLRTISAEWRRKFGLSVLINKAIEAYEHYGGDKSFAGLVFASLRNPGETDFVHELGGEVVWIDASPKIRYERTYSRNRADDQKTYQQFLDEEQAEMEQTGDEATLNMSEVKRKADMIFINNSSDLKELERRIAKEVLSS